MNQKTCKYCDKQTITPEMMICIDHFNVVVENMRPKIVKIIRCQRKNCLKVLEKEGFCIKHSEKKKSEYRIKYNDEQSKYLINMYINGVERKKCVENFLKKYPSTKHTLSSIEMKYCRIQLMDNTQTQYTEYIGDKQIERLCKDTNLSIFI
jgi:hypothetical protein